MDTKRIFERWAVQKSYSLDEVGAGSDRVYKEPITCSAWEAWKVAQKYYACLYDIESIK